MKRKQLKIGFISTRLAGTDGVTLETLKWAEVLRREGHECYFMAGELDTPPEFSFFFPECHFAHPDIKQAYAGCFGASHRTNDTTLFVEHLKHKLKQAIREFIVDFRLDLLVPENALTIPLNIPLGMAITEIAVESSIDMLAHHHDFFWERNRFMVNGCWDYLNAAFPPHLPMVQHAVINSSQDNQLSLRTGISATIIPNVMDFANPPPPPDDYADDLRDTLGIAPGEKLILQPTRIVARKGIEHAVELVHRIRMPAALVITHSAGDEGDDYARRVIEYSDLLGVKTIFCSDFVDEERGTRPDGKKIYTLADCYRAADLVTYPSTIEGFGNAFLEAIYYMRPLVVNNYSIYNTDIKPKGFRTVEMDGYVSEQTVTHALEVLCDHDRSQRMTEINYKLASRFFSYEVLTQKLRTLLVNCFGS